jgi:hypothetical protein
VTDRAGAILAILILWTLFVAAVVVGGFAYGGFSWQVAKHAAGHPWFLPMGASPFVLFGLWLWARRSLGL